ncbi:unnamed protein product [Prunus armeniaca]|uniref:DUF1308 domain-containing protein n=1 Tax=Prunus armeniaca TaxID=36596 RepID=A0A6J5XI09_PRUAR|nr:unnamed protein product [Prunus armeniaca]CAB4312123.1 unnamed protein product [Prunus armeniaca]
MPPRPIFRNAEYGLEGMVSTRGDICFQGWVVPNSPSERMMNLPTTRKLALKNKVIFGTSDYWCAPTVTANMAFVRAISQTGMSLFTIEHRPRALTVNFVRFGINESSRNRSPANDTTNNPSFIWEWAMVYGMTEWPLLAILGFDL